MRAYIITGTSSGLGKAFFDLLVEQEARVIAISRRFLPGQRETDRVRLVKRDLGSDIPTANELRQWLAADVDEVVFINNAFTDQPIGAAGKLRDEDLIRAARVNIIAPMLLVNALLGAVNEHVNVKLLNISAGAAKRPVAGWALYCASKAGMEMYFDVVALEGRVTAVNVNPGVMDTPMQGRIRGSDFPDRERFVAMKEKGELASPAEVARRIASEHLSAPLRDSSLRSE